MSNKVDKIYRAYSAKSEYTNQGKLDKIIALAKVYKQHFNVASSYYCSRFYKTGSVPAYPDRIEFKIKDNITLSQRYKTNCELHLISNLKSKLSNLENDIQSVILNSSLSKEEQTILLYLNKSHSWYKQNPKIKGVEVPLNLIKLLRRIFKHKKHNMPKMKNVTMHLNGDVVKVEHSETITFDYWIKLSTLQKNDVIYLPIKSYNYMNKSNGEIINAVQVEVKKDKISYHLIKESDINKKTDNTNVIAIDVGLVNLISSSSGNVYGSAFYEKIKHYDKLIQLKLKKMHKQSPELKMTESIRRLHGKVRDLIKNEVGRCLNRIIDKEKPKEIIIENIINISKETSKKHKRSKKVARMMNNAGMTQIPDRLKQKSEIHGFVVTKVNPAYTSQTCSSCGNVDKLNRKTQSKFKCTCCGLILNADYNASLNIFARRSDKDINVKTNYNKVKEILSQRFLSENTPVTGGL